MVTAFLLLNVELSKGIEIEEQLSNIKEIKAIFPVYGIYDYILKIETNKISKLQDIISMKIRKIHHIKSTLTLVTTQKSNGSNPR